MTFISLDKQTLIIDLQLEDLNDNEQDQIINLVTDILETKIFEMVLSNLSAEEQIEFLKLSTGGKNEELKTYADQSIENLDQKIEAVILDTKSELLKEIQSARGSE